MELHPKFPLEPKVLTPEVLSKAQQIVFAQNKKLGILVSNFGSMLVQKVGYLASKSRTELDGLNAIVIEPLVGAQESVTSGFIPAVVKTTGASPRELEKIWFSIKPEKMRSNVSVHVDGKTYRRIFQRVGISWGATRAYYLDEESGLVFSICIDYFKTQQERIESAVVNIESGLRNAKAENGGIVDAFPIVSDRIAEVSLEIRSQVLERVLALPDAGMSDGDREKLRTNKAIVFWADIRAQIQNFIEMVAEYRQKVPDEAKLDFPVNERAPFGFDIAPGRGVEFAKAWLQKEGISINPNAENIAEYLRGLDLVNRLNLWISLPIDRAILMAFRDGVPSHPDVGRSHLKVLMRATEMAGKVEAFGAEVSEAEAKEQYKDALGRLNQKIEEWITAKRASE